MSLTEPLLKSPGDSAAPASGALPILRLDPADLSETLDRLGEPEALAAGLVNVIGLDGVAARFGSRWSLRRELVHEHVQRVLRRHLGDEVVFERIGEVHYVVAQSGRSRLRAQRLCLRCLREILQHFVGEVRLPDMRLHEVTRIAGGEIVGQKLEVSATALAEAAAEPGAEDGMGGATPPAVAGPLPDPQSLAEPKTFTPRRSAAFAQRPRLPAAPWTPFVASNGQTVRVSCVLEPVIRLGTSSRIGFRLARRVMYGDRPLNGQELRDLSRADIARVDFASITRGIDRLRAESGAEKHLSLIVSVSFATLSNQRTREILVGLLEEARAEVRLGLVCEICELDGVPPSALLTAVSLIKPFCVRVLAFVTEQRPAALQRLKGLGLAGVSMECPLGQGDAEFVAWAGEMARAARAAAGALFLYRVHPTERGALASLAGVSHATLLANIGPPAEASRRRPSGPA